MSRRRRMLAWVGAAAILLFAVAGWLWVRTRTSLPIVDTAVLDLRDRSPVRGPATEPALPPLEIARTVKHLVLDLPIGSKEGSYDVALLNEAGDVVLRTTGTAQLEDHNVIMRVNLDFSRPRRGSYSLGVRQDNLEWTRFPVRAR